MNGSFDAYYIWLGIPPSEQPPNHYRLLGLAPFEDQPQIVINAADRQMAHLRTFQTGPHSHASQLLLNEVAAAKLVLLHAAKRAEYDQQLRASLPVLSAGRNASVGPNGAKRVSRANEYWGIAVAALTTVTVILAIGRYPITAPSKQKGAPLTLERRGIETVSSAPTLPAGGNPPYEKPPLAEVASNHARPKFAPVSIDASPSASQESTPNSSGVSDGSVEESNAPPQPDSVVGDEASRSPSLVTSSPAHGDDSPQKYSLPTEEQRREIETTLKDTFNISRAMTRHEQLAKAKELKDFMQQIDQPAQRYVALELVAQLAQRGADIMIMLDAVERMDAEFEIDVLSKKQEMLSGFLEGTNYHDRLQQLLPKAEELIDELMAAKRIDDAEALAKKVYDPSQTTDKASLRRGLQLFRQVDPIYRAHAKLRNDPNDEQAIRDLGRTYCFVRNEWASGLPYLAKGSNTLLRELAKRELEAPPAGWREQIDLADAWWEAADPDKNKVEEKEVREAIQRHARTWYERAEGQIDDNLLKKHVESRLQQAAKRQSPKPSKGTINNSLGMRLMLVQPGEFWMGNEDSAAALNQIFPETKRDKHMLTDAAPRHKVQISQPFYLGTYEVTVGQFRQFVEATGYRTDAETDGKGGKGWDRVKRDFVFDRNFTWRTPGWLQTDEHPVVNVSWNDAQQFCQWLSQREGSQYRLPTEAEWEYACRAGTTTYFYSGDNPEWLPRVANLADAAAKSMFSSITAISANDGYVFTAPVGRFQPNAFGLFDMHGNVWEWCQDGYDENYYASLPPFADPRGPATSDERVYRGGGCKSSGARCRSAARRGGAPDLRMADLGFRIARTADRSGRTGR